MSALLLLSRFYLCSYLLPTWLATTNSPFVLPQSCHLTLVISLDKKKKKKGITCSSNWSYFPNIYTHSHLPVPMVSHSCPLPSLSPLVFFPVSLFPCSLVFHFPLHPLPPFFRLLFLVPSPACSEVIILPILEQQQQQQDSMGYLAQNILRPILRGRKGGNLQRTQ
ncbi:hypothetical protein BKA57DRAFT_22246 [Linnemannia elongata]|nr:hypothetical protein BKA57DRAFT_22246 [Linnemannia elongata]